MTAEVRGLMDSRERLQIAIQELRERRAARLPRVKPNLTLIQGGRKD
jgi:hypothetical protein